MRDLTSEGETKEYDLEEIFSSESEITEGISVTIDGDYHDFVSVKLNNWTLRLNVQQARDLALALRKAANKIERGNMDDPPDRVNQWIK